MTAVPASPVSRVYGTVELLEYILLQILSDLHEVAAREDPRSHKSYHNARRISQVLRLTQVNRHWRSCILNSPHLSQALFLKPSTNSDHRSWYWSPSNAVISTASDGLARPKPPTLNPTIQVAFPWSPFRFWHLPLEQSNYTHVAYIVMKKEDVMDPTGECKEVKHLFDLNISVLDELLLSQPPIRAMEASVWDRDYTNWVEPGPILSQWLERVEFPNGATFGELRKRVQSMFIEHPEALSVRLITV
ncbi:hypothetical protein K431DRAFT_286727 [Polychaeton citri CBS 116435]|uniref:F-box domain-containing protein n=1 Tax=Polychaeton citri CBS 116435 TaxID=1314669 RepID=A0A9P4Q6Q2_9PEZI|nr:hypothetical protein K431DRAFT_286727 [Polychaeton citri CBS 116435]